jgi:hypothetical protein
MCPICGGPLVPILYGYKDPKYFQMNKDGLIHLINLTYHNKKSPTAWCNKCSEGFNIKLKHKF